MCTDIWVICVLGVCDYVIHTYIHTYLSDTDISTPPPPLGRGKVETLVTKRGKERKRRDKIKKRKIKKKNKKKRKERRV